MKNNCVEIQNLYNKELLPAYNRFKEMYKNKNHREEAKKLVHSLQHLIEFIEDEIITKPILVDLRPLIDSQRLKDKYPHGAEFELLKDGLPAVIWRFYSNTVDDWIVIFEYNDNLYFLQGFNSRPNPTALDCELFYRNPELWLRGQLSHIECFKTAKSLIDWICNDEEVVFSVPYSERIKILESMGVGAGDPVWSTMTVDDDY